MSGLDELVAEKVMGWPTEGMAASAAYRDENMPHYSTDIAAAWAVVERLERPSIHHGDDWYVTCLDEDMGVHQAWADTAPLAICLVALKANGVNVGEMLAES